jgi:hypothetical protein
MYQIVCFGLEKWKKRYMRSTLLRTSKRVFGTSPSQSHRICLLSEHCANKETEFFFLFNFFSFKILLSDHLRYLNLAGKIIGRALVDSCLVPVEFVRPLYKQMVSAPILLEDIASVDTNLCESLMYMHKNSIAGVFFSRFVHTYEELGETKDVPLLPGGEEIEVSESNKDLFISLTIKYKTFSVIAKEVEAFLGGLYSVVPERLLVVFQWYELRSLLCGLTAIDVDDWKKHTTYHSHCDDAPEVIEWFWAIVER